MGDGEALSIALQYLTVAGIAAAAFYSLWVAFAVGPGKDFLVFSFLEESPPRSDGATSFGRRLRRPNRENLRDPETRLKAIQRYRARAQAALASGGAPSRMAMNLAFRRLGLVMLATLGLSTLAFATFVGAHAFLFDGMESFVDPKPEFWNSVVALVGEHVRSAFAFNMVACTGEQVLFRMVGIGMEEASQIYRLMMAWSVPAIMQRAVRAGSLLFQGSKFDQELVKIANASDEDILLELAAYAEE